MSDICTVKKSTLDGIAKQTQRLTGSTEQMKAGEIAGKLEDVPSQPAKGLVFSEYDSDGYPHKAEFVGSWTAIPSIYCYFLIWSNQAFARNITSIKIPDTVTAIGSSAFMDCRTLATVDLPDNNIEMGMGAFNNCTSLTSVTFKRNVDFRINAHFSNCTSLTSVIFGGDVINPAITNSFKGCSAVMLYDFSHATFVPPLYSTDSLGHATGCVIRIPSALSDQTLGTGNGWESATNWSGLTNIVWEVV